VAVWLFSTYPARDFTDDLEVDHVMEMLTERGVQDMDRAAARRIYDYRGPSLPYMKRGGFWDKWRLQRMPGIEDYFEKALEEAKSKDETGRSSWAKFELDNISDRSLVLYRLDHEDAWKKEYFCGENSKPVTDDQVKAVREYLGGSNKDPLPDPFDLI